MDTAAIRIASLAEARRLGYQVSPGLPLLDSDIRLRSLDDVLRRCLARYVAIAVAFGLDRSSAWPWIKRHGLADSLAPSELGYVQNGIEAGLKVGVESLWAMCWAVGIVGRLDFGELCGNDLITRFPDLTLGEDPSEFVGRAKLRSRDEIASSLDLAYCLHWSLRQAVLLGSEEPGRVPGYVVEERRRALEWLFSNEPWDLVSLDT